MRKIVTVLVLMAVLLCMIPAVSAAGSAYWGGPSVVRAGDTIVLTFYAGGGIYGGSGAISYNSDILTLQSCTPAIGGNWAVELGGSNFVFYDNTMRNPITGSSAIFQATFQVSASAQPGAEVWVRATGVTLSDGEQDMGMGTVSYSKTVAEPLSDNCNLASMTVTGATISPAFSAQTTRYTAKVPFTVSSIGVEAKAEHDGAKVSVSNPTLAAGATTNVVITVTAENGTTKSYTIAVAREQDPNYVESDNANLSSLSVDGYAMSPAFSPEVLQYYVWLPYEAKSVAVNAEQEDKKAQYQIGAYEQLIPGKGTDIAVTVTAEDGSQKVYTVTVVRAPSHDQVEQFLAGEREPEPTEPEPTDPPATQPQELEEKPAGYSTQTVILVAVAGILAGAAIVAIIWILSRKKR